MRQYLSHKSDSILHSPYRHTIFNYSLSSKWPAARPGLVIFDWISYIMIIICYLLVECLLWAPKFFANGRNNNNSEARNDEK